MKTFIIGRDPSSDLVLNNYFVSRAHALIAEDQNGAVTIQDNGSSNGTRVNNSRNLVSATILNAMDLVYFSEDCAVPGSVLLSNYEIWKASGCVQQSSLTLGAVFSFVKDEVTLGSSPKRDVCIPVLGVAANHLLLKNKGPRWSVSDLAGKVFCQGKEIGENELVVNSGDILEIGAEVISITYYRREIIIARLRKGFSLEAKNLTLTVKDRDSGLPKELLKNISISVLPGELVALMGPSGSGKTTLLNILSGSGNATEGHVLYDGKKLEKGSVALTSYVGYVPQDDILYSELTVKESLFYSTRYRVEENVSDAQIKSKVIEVCKSVGFNESVMESIIGSPERKILSGGQRKRVNLAMELITDPLLLFLDEPTSGLSSRDTRIVIEALSEIARTMSIAIVVTIHQPAPRIYDMFDKVVYLKEGQLAYYGGTAPQSLSYFSDEKISCKGPDEVMEVLEERDTKLMSSKYTETDICQKLVKDRSELLSNINTNQSAHAEKKPYHWLKQAHLFTKRYATCRIRDWQSIMIQIGQGPLIGVLMGIGLAKTNPNTSLFLFVFIALWFGTNNTARELVCERTLFRREKRSGANVWAMLISKLSMNCIITLVQCFLLLFVARLFLKDLTFGLFVGVFICWLTSVVGIALGLLISAIAKTEVSAIVITPIVLIPFILFGGLMVKYNKEENSAVVTAIMNITPSSWGYQALVNVETIGHVHNTDLNALEAFRPFMVEEFNLEDSERWSIVRRCIFVLIGMFAILVGAVWWKIRSL